MDFDRGYVFTMIQKWTAVFNFACILAMAQAMQWCTKTT